MNLTKISLLLMILIIPSYRAGAESCLIEGDPVHWIADYCMSTLETDDEIPAMDCISQELRRTFENDCVAKRHYKRALCELALSRQTITGTLASCLAEPDFMGPAVRNKGIGN